MPILLSKFSSSFANVKQLLSNSFKFEGFRRLILRDLSVLGCGIITIAVLRLTDSEALLLIAAFYLISFSYVNLLIARFSVID